MSKEQNIEKEENFPKDPENITKNELHEHFDLDNDGRVTLEDYSEHIDYHCENPEVLEDKMEQAKYDRGFKYKKGGLVAKKLSKKETDIILNSLFFFLSSSQDDYNRITVGGIKVKYDLLEKLIDKIEYRGLSFNAKQFAEGGETISGVRVPEMEYGEVSKTEDERREIIDKHRYAKSIGDTEMANEALEQYRMFCAVKGFKKGGLTSDKAKKMLEDGTAQGKKLTDKQKRYFGYIAGGGKGKYAEGGLIKGKLLKYFPMDEGFEEAIFLLPTTKGAIMMGYDYVVRIYKFYDGTKNPYQDGSRKSISYETYYTSIKPYADGNNWGGGERHKVNSKFIMDEDDKLFKKYMKVFEDIRKGKYAKGGFIKVGSDRDKAHQFLRKGGYYKKYYEEVQDLVEPGDGKNTESGMFVFDNKSDASDALYEMKMEGINIVDTDVKDYAEGGVVIHHNWDMFQRKYTGWNVLDFNDIQRVIHTFPTEEEAKRFVKRRGYKDRSNEITIFEKGGLIYLVKESEVKPKYYNWEDYDDDREEHWIDKDNNGYQAFTLNRLLSDSEIKKIKNILKRNNTFGYYEDGNEHIFTITSETNKIKDKVIDEIKKEFPKDKLTEAFAKGGKTESNDTYIEEFIDEDTGESVFIERSRKKQKQIAEDSKSYNKIKKRNQMKAVRLQSELFNISWEIKSLESDLNDIEQTIKENIFETEETAEPEGGPIANRLGAELEDLERRKIAIKKLISKKTQDTYDLEDRLDRLEYL